MSTRRPPGGPLPEGWEFFKPFNRPVWFCIGAKHPKTGKDGIFVFGVLPMKCPLDRVFEKHLASKKNPLDGGVDTSETVCPSREELLVLEKSRTSTARYLARLPVERLRDVVARSGVKGDLCAVINLCATDRYYDSRDLGNQGISYIKFPLEGGGKMLTPRKARDLIQTFKQLAFDYGVFFTNAKVDQLKDVVRQQQANLPLIGLHCTHGVNRTGYCLLMWMCYCKLTDIQKGLNVFYKSRGHDLNKPEFADHVRFIWQGPDNEFSKIRQMVLSRAGFCL